MKIDVRNIIILMHPNKREVLLLKRDPAKKLFPNLITGLGGKVELESGEGNDLTSAMWRELLEETQISKNSVREMRLKLITTVARPDEIVILLWYKGTLISQPENLDCTEGSLQFYKISDLEKLEYIPTARDPIQFVTKLPEEDSTVYTGIYDSNLRLIHNKSTQ